MGRHYWYWSSSLPVGSSFHHRHRLRHLRRLHLHCCLLRARKRMQKNEAADESRSGSVSGSEGRRHWQKKKTKEGQQSKGGEGKALPPLLPPMPPLLAPVQVQVLGPAAREEKQKQEAAPAASFPSEEEQQQRLPRGDPHGRRHPHNDNAAACSSCF